MIQTVEQPEPLSVDESCRELIGGPYSLWRPGAHVGPGLSHQVSTSRDTMIPTAEADAIAELVRHVASSGQPLLRRISNEQFAWAIPAGGLESEAVAVRIVKDNPEVLAELVNRMSQCAWTRELDIRHARAGLRDQDEQLLAYAAQVSMDLEELTWLRNLASNLELSQSGNSVERIAETVLPSLCRLINAYTLVFVRDVAVTSLDSNLPIVWQTGSVRIAKSHCLSIIDNIVGNAPHRTVVRNYCGSEFANDSFKGVESCVLVPVATESARLGWLLAVNKDVSSDEHHQMYGDLSYKTYMSEQEFGSFEASLMSATAVVLAAHGRNCGLFNEKELLLRGVIRSMINAIDAKDSYTCGHSDRVAEFARLISRALSLDFGQCEQIYMTGLLHDVGKIGVPDHVLKKPGKLTEQEFELIKQHPVIGHEILSHLENLSYVLPGVLHHHEAVDGSGYPHGLKGDAIPLMARILAVADAYDAMTSNRPYRRGMPTERAEQILREGAGSQWDTSCVDAFFRTVHGIRMIASQRSTPESIVPMFQNAMFQSDESQITAAVG